MEDFKKDSLYHVFSQVMKLHFHRAHSLLNTIDIYPGQPPMLFALHIKDGQSQKELAEKLKVKPATITVMLKRMENAGLLERRPDENDQRISRAYFTDKGREAYEKVHGLMKIIEAECFENFTIEEKILLKRLLMQMKDNLEDKVGMVNNHCMEKQEDGDG
ncbi:MAG: MarR family transcriptional regulator [Clostridium lundense]|nr:MarR family transcriptional regulator [Clostridium lundense]